MEDQNLVIKSIEQIFILNGYRHLDGITHRDYNIVADKIYEKTDVVISVSTLKRLSKGQFSKAPQVSTLNALAIYLGFNHWQDYKMSLLEVTPKPHPNFESGHRFRNLALSSVFLSLLFLSGYILKSNLSYPPSQAEFSCHKTTSNLLPNTVVFHYKLDGIKGDSFFIQQSWDQNRRVKIDPKDTTLTDIYFEPGNHIAKLIADQKIIKKIPVKIPTKSWFFYAKDADFTGRPDYIKANAFQKDGKLSLSKTELIEAGLAIEQEKHYYYSWVPDSSLLDSEEFIFQTKLRTTPIINNHCLFSLVEVMTETEPIYFEIMQPGCENLSIARFGDKFISGKTENLSSFAHLPSEWLDVMIRAHEKQIEVYYGERKIYQTKYAIDFGSITGFSFISNGLCEVDYIKLTDLAGKEIYTEHFEGQTLSPNPIN